jgi:hypothetical protein
MMTKDEKIKINYDKLLFLKKLNKWRKNWNLGQDKLEDCELN